MTTSEEDLNRSAPATAAVGYGRPPVEHRFQKGNRAQSEGKRRKVKRADEVLPQLPAESLHEMLMLEGQRLVRVKAGGRWVEIPMIQAAFREVGMRAAKGDRLAMTSMAKLMMESSAAADRAPRGRRRTAPACAPAEAPSPEDSPAIVAAEEYTQVWTRLLCAAEKQGLQVAPPVPHPDEVAIGRVRGTVQWPGARGGETLSLDGMARMHAEMQAALPRDRRDIEAMAEGPDKAEAWCRWFAASDALDLIEYHLPRRYAGQIDPTEPTSAERLRDRSLRELAEFDRDRFAREREAGAEADVVEPETMAPDDATVPIEAEAESAVEAAGPGPVAETAPEPEPEATPAPAPMPSPEVAEAEVYCGAWIDLLEAQSQMQFARYGPTPHPDEVRIEEAAGRVTYAADVPADKRATLASLRDTLAALQADARQFEIDERWAKMSSTEHFVKIAKRKREQVVELCGYVEWWLDEG